MTRKSEADRAREALAKANQAAEDHRLENDPSVPGFATEKPEEHTIDRADTMPTGEEPGRQAVLTDDAKPDGNEEPELGEKLGKKLMKDQGAIAFEGTIVDPATGLVTRVLTSEKAAEQPAEELDGETAENEDGEQTPPEGD